MWQSLSITPSTSGRHIISRGDARVVVQGEIQSDAASFLEFHDDYVTFVDKSLIIEAFLRKGGARHLILRPRRCGKSYTLSMIQAFLQRPPGTEPSSRDITTSLFAGMAIADHSHLVSKHFQQYPVLYIDLKEVKGITYEQMLERFDDVVIKTLRVLSSPYTALRADNFCADIRGPALPAMRAMALTVISEELLRVYQKRVVILIDEYDTPMHSAIEHGYVHLANAFFGAVFGSLLKTNYAVYACMMVGICKIAKSGWLSSLNNLSIFPMHAEDDRYAKFFLFTEKEVEILCESHGGFDIKMLEQRYNGYAATSKSGPVKLYNPFSVMSALSQNRVSNFWVDTGRYAPLSQNLWRAGPGFCDNLDLIMQRNVKLRIDEHVDFSYDDISDAGLWGLLYYTGYLTIESVENRLKSEFIFRIPNGEVSSEWHRWVVNCLEANNVTPLSGFYDTLIRGDAEGFQRQFTAFLQEYLSLFCTPYHKEKVYEAMFFMLVFALFGKEYDVRMEQDAGHGRSDITARPLSERRPALLFETKSVAPHFKRSGRRVRKTAERIEKELKNAKTEGLGQLADRRYCERVPLNVKTAHEFSLAFSGKFCVAGSRTLRRNDREAWEEESAARSTDVSEFMVDDADEDAVDVANMDVDDEDEED